jgi:hypothetical protein
MTGGAGFGENDGLNYLLHLVTVVINHFSPLNRYSVFLEPTAGSLGNCVFNQSRFKRRMQII